MESLVGLPAITRDIARRQKALISDLIAAIDAGDSVEIATAIAAVSAIAVSAARIPSHFH